MIQDSYDRFLDSKPKEDYRIEGHIVGRIKRLPGVGREEALRRATQYAWYDATLRYDGRCKRWHVFRSAS